MRAEALQHSFPTSPEPAPVPEALAILRDKRPVELPARRNPRPADLLALRGKRSVDLLALSDKRSAAETALLIRTGAEWEQQAALPRQWSYGACVGRLVELSGGSAAPLLSMAFALVADAQRAGEPTAWIQGADSTFFPPDAARNGVDLNALVVVRLQDPAARARAAVRLLRSGAFGLVAMDLGTAPVDGTAGSRGSALDSSAPSARGRRSPAHPRSAALPPALLGKLGQLAQQHGTAVCCLTVKRADWASLGSLVSLRGEAVRRRTGEDRFTCTVRVLKDKRNGPGWTHEEVLRGAPGLP